MHSCTAKKALVRGIRPTGNQKFIFAVCSRSCLYCDIWRLATLVTTHVPLSVRYSAAYYRQQRQELDFQRSEKRIQAQLQTQRSRVASIMSICTVDGAEYTEGLHMAFDRCFSAVQDILCEEAELEEKLIRPSANASAASSRRPSWDMELSCGVDSIYYPTTRRSSRVGITI